MIFFNHFLDFSWGHSWRRMIGCGVFILMIFFVNDLGVMAQENAEIGEPVPVVRQGIAPRSASVRLTMSQSPVSPSVSDGQIAGTNAAFMSGASKNPSYTSKTDENRFYVGVLLPLSGAFSTMGQDFLDAIILALFDVNDKNIILLVADSKGTKEGAAAAADDVILRGADVILGPVFDYTIVAASTVSRRAAIPLIGFSANRHVVGQGVYLLNFSPEQQVDRVVAFAMEQDIVRFAALIPEGRYGRQMEDSFRAAVAKYGGEIIQIIYYSAQFEQLENAARELANSDVGEEGDAVFIPEGGSLLISLVSFLTHFDIDPQVVRLLGTGLWDDPVLAREPSLRQGWFSSPSHHSGGRFQEAFRDHMGHIPARIVELGYDAFLIASMLRNQAKNPENISSILTRDGGFSGINGLFRFLPNGLSERGLSIFEVGKNTMEEISPAENTFQ